MRKKRLMAPEGVCPRDRRQMTLIQEDRSEFCGHRRMRLYRCECGLVVPFWHPSFRVEKNEFEVEQA